MVTLSDSDSSSDSDSESSSSSENEPAPAKARHSSSTPAAKPRVASGGPVARSTTTESKVAKLVDQPKKQGAHNPDDSGKWSVLGVKL